MTPKTGSSRPTCLTSPTYVTVMGGDSDTPCGAALEVRTSGAALPSTWGRREVVIDGEGSNAGELQARGDMELEARSRARTRLKIAYLQASAPFAFGALWLGDTATVTLPTIFGGSQSFRCIEVRLNLERPEHAWVQYDLEKA